ncbi:MAG: very short patch repair endonuclease [Pseudonocardiaceae bacterium]
MRDTSPRPAASSEGARDRMSRQRQRDTGPELAVRQRVHAMGLRYRVDAPLPGLRRRADMLFSGARVAVFVDGCFWHGCPQHATTPKSNTDWWREKIAANVRRDHDTDATLRSSGWEIVRIWAHEPPDIAAARVASIVSTRTARG